MSNTIKTPNIGLYITPEATDMTFKEWRLQTDGEGDSNMKKIDGAFGSVMNDLEVLRSFQEGIYGVKFVGSASNGTRLGNAENMTAAVGVDDTVPTNDFDSVYPWAGMKRCNGYYDANGDFVVTAYEGEPGYAVDGTNGNVWVEVPQFWVKEVIDPETETEEKYIAPFETQGYRLPEKFIKLNGAHRGKAYIAAYESGMDANGMPVSISGVDVTTPAWSHNKFLNACNTHGDVEGYCAFTMEDQEIISFLFQIEFATRHSQGIMAGVSSLKYSGVAIAQDTSDVNYVYIAGTDNTYVAGDPVKIHATVNSVAGDYHIISAIETEGDYKKVIFEDGASITATTGMLMYGCPYKTGCADTVKAPSGSVVSNTDGKHAFKYRGIENVWGNTWTEMSGILINDLRPYILKDAGKDPVDSKAASITEQMTALSYTVPGANGQAKAMGYDEAYPTYRITSDATGSTSTYYRDYFSTGSGVRAGVFGGSLNFDARDGLFCFGVYNAPNHSSWNYSSRLSYVG